MFVLGSNPALALIILRQFIKVTTVLRFSDFVGSLEYVVFVIGAHDLLQSGRLVSVPTVLIFPSLIMTDWGEFVKGKMGENFA